MIAMVDLDPHRKKSSRGPAYGMHTFALVDRPHSDSGADRARARRRESQVPFTVPEPDKAREALEEQAIRTAYIPDNYFMRQARSVDIVRCTECGEPLVDDGNEIFCPNPECVLGKEIE